MVVPTLRASIVAVVEALTRIQHAAECIVAVIVVMAVMGVVVKSPATSTKNIERRIAAAREGTAMPRAHRIALYATWPTTPLAACIHIWLLGGGRARTPLISTALTRSAFMFAGSGLG